MDNKTSKSSAVMTVTFLYGCLLLLGGLILFSTIFLFSNNNLNLMDRLLYSVGSISAIGGGVLYIIFSIRMRRFDDSARVMTIRLSFFIFLIAVLSHGAALVFNIGWWLIMFPIIIAAFFINPLSWAIFLAMYLDRDSVKKQVSQPKDKWQIINEAMSEASSGK